MVLFCNGALESKEISGGSRVYEKLWVQARWGPGRPGFLTPEVAPENYAYIWAFWKVSSHAI